MGKGSKALMGSLKDFCEGYERIKENPSFSNIDVRADCECPNCGSRLQLLWHLYPQLFAKYPESNGGFSFIGIEEYQVKATKIVD
ncbi:hypothetical protein LCGC14_1079170 [marine sediment metagenome]|uniref:Uncharacterized protein n=1 Tax=marine sediment metagenome TaxID=412755 RepID=A0A0F9PYY9_9ZZZZ